MTAHVPHLLSIRKSAQRGFTLIELLVVIAIIGVLTAIGTASYGNAQVKSRDAKRKADLKQIQVALELYKADNGHYPLGGWYVSTNGGAWLLDNGTTPISPTYIQQMPKDSINTAPPCTTSPDNWNATTHIYGTPGCGPFYSSYVYAYWSWDAGTCTRGQSYILAARLENANDPDTIAHAHTNGCGVTNWFWASNWDANSYVLMNP